MSKTKPTERPKVPTYAEMHPEDLMSLIREGDAEARAYLSSLPVDERRTKARAGAKAWRPLLVKRAILDEWAAEIEPRTCPHCGAVKRAE
jgi:hypothetical protein